MMPRIVSIVLRESSVNVMRVKSLVKWSMCQIFKALNPFYGLMSIWHVDEQMAAPSCAELWNSSYEQHSSSHITSSVSVGVPQGHKPFPLHLWNSENAVRSHSHSSQLHRTSTSTSTGSLLVLSLSTKFWTQLLLLLNRRWKTECDKRSMSNSQS